MYILVQTDITRPRLVRDIIHYYEADSDYDMNRIISAFKQDYENACQDYDSFSRLLHGGKKVGSRS